MFSQFSIRTQIQGVAVCIAVGLTMMGHAPAQTFTVLYSFQGGADGSGPYTDLVLDPAGNLYGTTQGGGTGCACGTVFEVSPATHEERVLFSFPANFGGIVPGPFGLTGILEDKLAYGFGTTEMGGVSGNGSVFQIDKAGNESEIYSFTGGQDGAEPASGVTGDDNGNLYGVTVVGGMGLGTVFKLSPSGGGWGEKTLYSFHGALGGYNATGKLLVKPSGTIYGALENGGPHNAGAIFQIDASGNEFLLYSFEGVPDGANPTGSLLVDSGGNLYGMTVSGGVCGGDGCGIVFRIDQGGHEVVVHKFAGAPDDGANPQAGLVADAEGNIYGTTFGGGAHDDGTVFKISRLGQESILYSFTGEADGMEPQNTLAIDRKGTLYGTTQGGTGHNGVVFALTTK